MTSSKETLGISFSRLKTYAIKLSKTFQSIYEL
nr:MAG TPA: hypothetical protein [Bacteriophage sp.]